MGVNNLTRQPARRPQATRGYSLQIGNKFDAREFGVCKQRGNRLRLSIADFEHQEAARFKRRECRRNQPPVDVEPILAGKQRQRRLMVADFDRERVAIGRRHVRRIGDDEVKTLCTNRREQIPFKKADAICEANPLGIATGKLQRGC